MTPAENTNSIPDFDGWVDACFTRSKKDEFWSQSRPSGEVLAEYLARLFENPAFLATRYTREQLAKGIWFICGCVSGYFHDALDRSVPETVRRRWLRAISRCYTDLFDPLCRSVSPEKHETDPLCSAVFMLWDMDSLSFAETFSELREDCFDVLQSALQCQSETCIRSGLHGIGHWIERADYDGDAELAARLRKCIDEFVHRYRRDWMRRLAGFTDRFLRVRADRSPGMIQYAKDARRGCIL